MASSWLLWHATIESRLYSDREIWESLLFANWFPLFREHKYHRPAERLYKHRGSFVIRSKDAPKMCVIFVHGFNGCPTETWTSHHELLTSDSAFRAASLYFYQYDSKHTG